MLKKVYVIPFLLDLFNVFKDSKKPLRFEEIVLSSPRIDTVIINQLAAGVTEGWLIKIASRKGDRHRLSAKAIHVLEKYFLAEHRKLIENMSCVNHLKLSFGFYGED